MRHATKAISATLVCAAACGLIFVRSSQAAACDASDAPPATWRHVASSPEWAPGYSFDLVPFRGELWILGAGDGNWRSADAAAWTAAPADTDFDLLECEFAALGDAVYAVGTGAGRPDEKPKVWRSTDGLQWSVVNDDPPWPARRWPELLAHDGRLWLLGGYTSDAKDLNDVWFSTDGATWTCASKAAPWRARCMFSAVSLNGALWVMGGRANMDGAFETNFNDVWTSDDGASWRRIVRAADWSKRYGASAAAWDGRLWIIGGTRFRTNDEVWSSADGVHWTRQPGDHFGPRFLSGAAAFDDRLWVAGGKLGGGVFTNEVWTLERAPE